MNTEPCYALLCNLAVSVPETPAHESSRVKNAFVLFFAEQCFSIAVVCSYSNDLLVFTFFMILSI